MNRKELFYESILLLGPPGSGKGTQCQELVQTGNYFTKSSGSALREIAHSDFTPLGDRIREDQAANRFTADSDLKEVIYRAIGRSISTGSFKPLRQYLLPDGFPRTVSQVALLDFLDIKQCIVLDNLDADRLIERISDRARIAAEAGEQIRLEDTDSDKIRARIRDFNTKTLPLVEEFDHKMIYRIDGSLAAEEVTTQISRIILKK